MNYCNSIYVQKDDDGKITLFGQYFPTEIDDFEKNTHTSLKIYQNNDKIGKSFHIYGTGTIDTSKWNKWSDFSFKNDDISLIVVNHVHVLYIAYELDGEVHKLEFDPRHDGKNLYMPQDSKILSLTIINVKEEEYFKPRCCCKKQHSSPVKSNHIVEIILIILHLIILILDFIFLAMHIKVCKKFVEISKTF